MELHDTELSPELARWKAFARQVAGDHESAPEHQKSGSLTVIGSGLGLADLALDSKSTIQSADRVFHCLYDPITQAWLNEIRPDAFDLCVLYSDGLNRYETYSQMAECMLHFVRKGESVVAIYYGHPGVFASPTHRAISIARAEGHRAVMRPGISALDHLVADVGFDPAYPGLITYEASDMLLRGRRLDPQLHVVLWQVGVVGEFGYRRSGYRNEGFHVLARALESCYGGDWPLVHYVSSRFPGTDALIERVPISQILDPDFVSSLSALSTFYIPPRDPTETDRAIALELGAIRESEFPGSSPPVYDISGYHDVERKAISKLGQFEPDALPPRHQRTPGVNFLIALSERPELAAQFELDPDAVLSEPRFADLSDRAKALLRIGHPKAVDALIRERI